MCPKLHASVLNKLLNTSFIQVLALWCALGFCLIKLRLFCVYHLFFNSPLKCFYWDVGHGSGLIGMENVCFGWLGCAVGGGEGQSTFGRTWDDYNAKHSSITLSLLFFFFLPHKHSASPLIHSRCSFFLFSSITPPIFSPPLHLTPSVLICVSIRPWPVTNRADGCQGHCAACLPHIIPLNSGI